ncbi:hypothetical protein SAMN05216467_0266 [Cellulomonas sp. KH9]|nr:hypothetical protein SAMN05216467_0266 [Cellulomonas sp. KH9]
MTVRVLRRGGMVVGTTLTLVVLMASGTLAAGRDTSYGGQTSETGDAVELNARDGNEQQQRHESLKGTPAYDLTQYRRAPRCNVSNAVPTTPLNGQCPPADGVAGVNNCGEDVPLDALWSRERSTPTAAWSPWTIVDAGGCAADILPVLTSDDFRRLPLPAPTLTLQPDRGWALVNIETIVSTDPAPVTLRTDLLGIGVTVEATPRRWAYDFGDGHTLTTSSPGRPYPDHDVFHEYEQPGTTTITLTAEWTGRYQVDGSPLWRDVDGVASTTAATAPFTVEERTSRLVSGLCTDVPRPPDC